MGKTNRTYRDKLRRLEGDWGPFERALRRDYQPAWNDLWTHGKHFADAAGIQNEVTTMEPFLISVCLGQQHEIRELQERVEELEKMQVDR